MVAAIDASNLGSIGFHERLGFVEDARMSEVGWRFGRWRDLVLMHESSTVRRRDLRLVKRSLPFQNAGGGFNRFRSSRNDFEETADVVVGGGRERATGEAIVPGDLQGRKGWLREQILIDAELGLGQ